MSKNVQSASSRCSSQLHNLSSSKNFNSWKKPKRNFFYLASPPHHKLKKFYSPLCFLFLFFISKTSSPPPSDPFHRIAKETFGSLRGCAPGIWFRKWLDGFPPIAPLEIEDFKVSPHVRIEMMTMMMQSIYKTQLMSIGSQLPKRIRTGSLRTRNLSLFSAHRDENKSLATCEFQFDLFAFSCFCCIIRSRSLLIS